MSSMDESQSHSFFLLCTSPSLDTHNLIWAWEITEIIKQHCMEGLVLESTTPYRSLELTSQVLRYQEIGRENRESFIKFIHLLWNLKVFS